MACGSRLGGFDISEGSPIPAYHWDQLEKVCRYVLRPPVPESHLEYDGNLVILHLPRPRADGTTAVKYQDTVDRTALS